MYHIQMDIAIYTCISIWLYAFVKYLSTYQMCLDRKFLFTISVFKSYLFDEIQCEELNTLAKFVQITSSN
jgi:hypothetical protein